MHDNPNLDFVEISQEIKAAIENHYGSYSRDCHHNLLTKIIKISRKMRKICLITPNWISLRSAKKSKLLLKRRKKKTMAVMVGIATITCLRKSSRPAKK